MNSLSGIKNIIFDLGNVILDIHTLKTINEFEKLGFKHFNDLISSSKSYGFFHDFEIGQIDRYTFFDKIRKSQNINVSDQKIINAWNAMLGDYDPKRIRKIKQLKPQFRLFLLSNTNEIHYNAVLDKIPEIDSFEKLFDTKFLSYKMNISKPSVEIFEEVLTKSKIIASETLFLDDSPANVASALKTGMQSRVVNYPTEWLNWF